MNKHILSSIAFLIITLNSYSQIVYVKQNATGLNNGSSWSNAFTELSTAINSTTSGEIWVSRGTYFPLTDLNSQVPTNPRQKTFKLKLNIAIYGGFIGLETNLNQRNWVENPTILSGEIGNINDLTDNLIHVVSCEYSALNVNTILDGLIITGGYATTEGGVGYGGGIYVLQTYNGSFKIKNCVIKDNYSMGYGGGMYIYNSHPLIENCVFRSNAAYSGGAMDLQGCNATIKNCQIYENIATGHSLHWGEGGGIRIGSYSSPKIFNNSFTNNYAEYKGGCLFNSNNYELTFYNNEVSRNQGKDGGALFLDGNSYLFNNLFINNTARRYGGAVYMDYSGFGEFINNTVVLNTARDQGGGLYTFGPGPNVTNSIFYNNSSPLGPQIRTYNNVGNSPIFRYCNIQGGLENIGTYGTANGYQNNLDVNPSFTDAVNNNFRLQANSALINSGNTTIFPASWPSSNGQLIYFPNTDMDGNQRIVNSIDIGAYEYVGSLGIINPNENNSITIYPNPSNGVFNFKSNKDLESLTVYNNLGIKLFENSKTKGLTSISLIGYPSGLYFINFSIEDKIYNYKVIIE